MRLDDVAPDQQAAGPDAVQRRVELVRVEVGQFQIGPVVEPWTLGALACRQELPGCDVEALCDLPGGAGNLQLVDPRIELVRRTDAEHVALACAAQRHLKLAHAVDAVSRDPVERHAGRNSALDHAPGHPRLGCKTNFLLYMGRGQAGRIVRPGLWQVERTVDERVAVPRHIGRNYPDLAVRDLVRRTRVLPPHSAWCRDQGYGRTDPRQGRG